VQCSVSASASKGCDRNRTSAIPLTGSTSVEIVLGDTGYFSPGSDRGCPPTAQPDPLVQLGRDRQISDSRGPGIFSGFFEL
jgi:hypothetical protein